MLSVVVLICASTLSRSDCSAKTAVAVVVDRKADSSAECGLMAQAQVAATLQLQSGEYIKIVCRRAAPVNQTELSSR